MAAKAKNSKKQQQTVTTAIVTLNLFVVLDKIFAKQLINLDDLKNWTDQMKMKSTVSPPVSGAANSEFASQESLNSATKVSISDEVFLTTLKIAQSSGMVSVSSSFLSVVLCDISLGISSNDIKTALGIFDLNHLAVDCKKLPSLLLKLSSNTFGGPKNFKPLFVGFKSYVKAAAFVVPSCAATADIDLDFGDPPKTATSMLLAVSSVPNSAVESRLASFESHLSELSVLIKSLVKSIGALIVLVTKLLSTLSAIDVSFKKCVDGLAKQNKGLATVATMMQKRMTCLEKICKQACLKDRLDGDDMVNNIDDDDNKDKDFSVYDNTFDVMMQLWEDQSSRIKFSPDQTAKKDSVRIFSIANQKKVISSKDVFKAKLVNLLFGCTAFKISDLVSQVGGHTCFILCSPESYQCQCFAVVIFNSLESLNVAVSKTGTLYDCKKLFLLSLKLSFNTFGCPKNFKPSFVGSKSYAKTAAFVVSFGTAAANMDLSLGGPPKTATLMLPVVLSASNSAVESKLAFLEFHLSELFVLIKSLVKPVSFLVVLVTKLLSILFAMDVLVKKYVDELAKQNKNLAAVAIMMQKRMTCLEKICEQACLESRSIGFPVDVPPKGESASQPEENFFYAFNLTDDDHNMDELAINTSKLTRKKKKAKVDFVLDPNKGSKSTVNNNEPPKTKVFKNPSKLEPPEIVQKSGPYSVVKDLMEMPAQITFGQLMTHLQFRKDLCKSLIPKKKTPKTNKCPYQAGFVDNSNVTLLICKTQVAGYFIDLILNSELSVSVIAKHFLEAIGRKIDELSTRPMTNIHNNKKKDLGIAKAIPV
ncbi:hypothetical protein G9A89_012787 [Geosiphon pyriformis]|nr:hypothetical protein G9A89_012787 [Geosiphon pyriformis]